MTTETPADTLRRAATMVRELATAAANEAPNLTWEAEQVYDGAWTLDLGPATHPDRDSHDVGEDCRMPREIARHIAAWSPPAALAVADWLDSVAVWHDRITERIAEREADGDLTRQRGLSVAPDLSRPLAVALALLGEDS